MSHPTPTIVIDTLFPALSKKNSDIVALIKIAHPKMATLNTQRTKLNIVFAIDVSGSMAAQLRNSAPVMVDMPPIVFGQPVQPVQPVQPAPNAPWPMPDPFAPYLGVAQPQQPQQAYMNPRQLQGGFILPQQQAQYSTKMSRVKDAAIKAIGLLQEDDRFGIVSFDGSVTVVMESTLATPQAKASAIAKIKALAAGSSTALHAGWKCAAQMVCQNLDAKTVNRVLLLTDGEATDGIRDTATLAQHTSTMAEHGVTTSTFGVGDQYNETLMQRMAESGDGRYYYLEGDTNFDQMFAEEFQGMSRLYGNEARLRVHANDATLDFHNDLPVTPQGWKLPNAVFEREEYYLVTLKPSKVTKEALDFMVSYDYKHEGTTHTVSMSHQVAVVTQKAFSLMKPNDTVAKKQLELETARAKEKAMEALDRGDYHTSKTILAASACAISGSAYAASPEFMAQSARLETLMNVGDSGDHQKFRKMSSHDTYATRNNFDPKA